MLKMAVGQSDDIDPATAVADAIDQCRDQLAGRAPRAGILFAALDVFDPSLPAAVRDAFPGIDVIGSTSSAEMSSVAGYLEDSVALAVFATDEVELAVGFGDEVDKDAGAAVHAAVQQALAGTTKEPKVCLVLTEQTAGQHVVEALTTELPPGVLLIGGAAGRHELGGRLPTFQFLNDRISSTGVAILILCGPVAYSTAVGTGWRTLGPSGTVTRAAYGSIDEIDNKPAVEWASAYLDLVEVRTLGNPLAVQDPGMDGWYLRVVLGRNDSGALVIPGQVPVGATVQLTTTNPEDMLAATTDAMKRARDSYPGSTNPSAALIFSCAVRKYLLGSRTSRELAAARSELTDAVPIAGMYCIGEIAPTAAGVDSHFLNETFVALLLGTT
jgi:hypothetical protein